jgi:aryl-alcohol dehydrogenase-like predicted oxidoreductase
MHRRDFFCFSLSSATLLAGLRHFPHHLYAGAEPKLAQDRVVLGETGIEVSRLAQGTGTMGFGGASNQTRLGLKSFAELLRAGVDQGLSFWDVADDYGSHPGVKEALESVPRDKVVIMTKSDAKDEWTMKRDLDRYRQELGVDVIDIVLLHCTFSRDWPKRRAGAMAVLSWAKSRGLIRAHGVSCHTLEALETAAETDWTDVNLARLNPAGVQMDDDPDKVTPVLQSMRARGKGVLGMKILGAGNLRDRTDEALQYALASPLHAFTIGAESRDQLEDLLTKMPTASVRG